MSDLALILTILAVSVYLLALGFCLWIGMRPCRQCAARVRSLTPNPLDPGRRRLLEEERTQTLKRLNRELDQILHDRKWVIRSRVTPHGRVLDVFDPKLDPRLSTDWPTRTSWLSLEEAIRYIELKERRRGNHHPA